MSEWLSEWDTVVSIQTPSPDWDPSRMPRTCDGDPRYDEKKDDARRVRVMDELIVELDLFSSFTGLPTRHEPS